MDILLLSGCAVIGGAEGWGEIIDFGRVHLEWLKPPLEILKMEFRQTIRLPGSQ